MEQPLGPFDANCQIGLVEQPLGPVDLVDVNYQPELVEQPLGPVDLVDVNYQPELVEQPLGPFDANCQTRLVEQPLGPVDLVDVNYQPGLVELDSLKMVDLEDKEVVAAFSRQPPRHHQCRCHCSELVSCMQISANIIHKKSLFRTQLSIYSSFRTSPSC